MYDNRHYARTWRILRFLVGGALRRIFCYEHALVEPDAPNYLVVANHNTDLDPALVGLAFPRQMYFLASEHVFRRGFASRLLRYFFGPLSRVKGSTDAAAAMDVIRMLRKGNNLCLFAEGNRSFSGVTGPVFPATGKLAKASGAALVTFRLEGGYLTAPRWGKTLRRGRMRGRCMNVYTAERLKGMSADEVNAAIAADLFEDAFTRQLADPCDYRGKRLAEGLEDALFLCPVCGGVNTLRGHGDVCSCSACGLALTYTVRGFFEGKNAPFSTVRDWDGWQKTALAGLIEKSGDAPVFSNENMRLLVISADHGEQTVACGTLAMSREYLALGEKSFPIAEISDMALNGPSSVVFTAAGAHYEIAAAARRYCGRKYLLLYQLLRGR